MSRKSNKVQGRQQIAEREPTPQELAVAEKFEARRQNQQPGARLTAKRLSETNVGADLAGGPLEHLQAALLMENLATADPDAAMVLLRQVSRLVEPGGGDYAETQVNGVMALIRAINPANELETMLAVQMVATHLATMEHAWRLRVAETLAQMDFAERALSRLTRTFTMQMEALKRHRGSGEQKVTVRHVHEHAGDGSAASLQQGGEGNEKSGDQPHERVRLSERKAVQRSLEADRVPLQSTRRDRLERVPFPRRPRRAAGRGRQ